MITLKKDRSYLKVESWKEITELNGFRVKIDHKDHTLNEIIGRYIFAEKTHCGLKSCNQPHNKGYIVSTKDGLITNLGKDCGRRYFDVDFDKMAKTFDTAVTEHNNRNTINDFIFNIEHRKSEIFNLRNKHLGADWLNRAKKILTKQSQQFPYSVTEIIRSMIKSRSSQIMQSRLANKSEIERLIASGEKVQSPQYIDEQIGTFEGITALFQENDIRDILIGDLQQNINNIEGLDVPSLSQTELKRWAKWCSSYQGVFERAENIVSTGKVLLDIKNIGQFAPLIEDDKDQIVFNNFLHTLAKNESSKPTQAAAFGGA